MDAESLAAAQTSHSHARTTLQLATALYELDAAKRVIARLVQERNSAREALLGLNNNESSAMNIDSPPIDTAVHKLSKTLLDAITTSSANLSSARKATKQKQIDPEILLTYAASAPMLLYTAKEKNAKITALSASDTVVSIGGQDGSIHFINLNTNSVAGQIKLHKSQISSCFTPMPLAELVNGERTVLVSSGVGERGFRVTRLVVDKSKLKADAKDKGKLVDLDLDLKCMDMVPGFNGGLVVVGGEEGWGLWQASNDVDEEQKLQGEFALVYNVATSERKF